VGQGGAIVVELRNPSDPAHCAGPACRNPPSPCVPVVAELSTLTFFNNTAVSGGGAIAVLPFLELQEPADESVNFRPSSRRCGEVNPPEADCFLRVAHFGFVSLVEAAIVECTSVTLGGALFATAGWLRLERVNVLKSAATSSGAAFNLALTARLTLADATFENEPRASTGGAAPCLTNRRRCGGLCVDLKRANEYLKDRI
jgi:predicted outer membrane repeat protein